MEHKTKHKFAIVYGSRLYVNVTNKYRHYLQYTLDRHTYIKYISNMQVGSFPTCIVYHGRLYHSRWYREENIQGTEKKTVQGKKQIIFISE